LCRYLTAAFLNSSILATNSSDNMVLVRNAETEILHRLHNEIADLDISRQPKLGEILMAIIMFGLSTNWDGSNNPSVFHYNAAIRIYGHAYRNSRAITSFGGLGQDFFRQSLIYWWMGLALVTDTTKHCLLDPPEIPTATESIEIGKRVPHPLAGVSPEAQLLLGHVGSLVYGQRLRCCEKSFTQMKTIQQEYQALQKARQLEEELLSLQLRPADEFFDVADPETPLEDLVNIADAYRLSALVLLYRAFPDLLNSRLRLEDETWDHFQGPEEQRLAWLTAQAIHVLQCLCRNAQHSGTRSIEQLPLIIIAGELRLSSSTLGFQIREENEMPHPGSSLLGCSPSGDISGYSLDEISHPFLPFHGYWTTPDALMGPDYVSSARTTVLKRLKSVREILPYKSLEMVEELVLETWRLSDQNEREAFWMDVMIEKDWSFLLV
jgi:hypothetical protein